MRDYGKLYSTFWTSDTTRELSDRGKLLALYLLLGPHSNMIGCYRLPDGYVIEDLGWSKETVSKGFAELSRKGFVTVDEATKWVFIRRFLRWNPVDNPNQGKAAMKLFASIPNSFAAKRDLARELDSQGDKIDRTVLKPFLEPFPNGFETVSEPGTGTGVGTESGIGSGDCSEPPAASEPPIMIFPCVGVNEKEWPLFAAKVAQLKESFPGVDVIAECRKARQWCIDNPKKRKTFDGMAKFLSGWIGRAQDAPKIGGTKGKQTLLDEIIDNGNEFLRLTGGVPNDQH